MPEGWTMRELLRVFHITLGFAGLASFWVPIFATKGGRLHVTAGRLFVWCAYGVTLSALGSSAWGLLHPAGWVGRPDLGPEAAARIAAQVRPFLAILALLSAVTLFAVRQGIRAIRTRRDPTAFVNVEMYVLLGLVALTSAVLLGISGLRLAQRGADGMAVVGLVLGLGGFNEVRTGLRGLRQPRTSPKWWWYVHMECMLGAGIAFHTAFLVFGAGRYLEGWLPGPLALLPWLLPSAIGIPATSIWIRHYRRKFGEDQQRPVAEASAAASLVAPGRGR